MTYLWAGGDPIQVEVDERWGPVRFVWRARAHPVSEVTNRWRVDEEWWNRRIWREYFKLVTTTGLLVIVFRDLMTGEWYLQRLYD
jgi:hypothetical protein